MKQLLDSTQDSYVIVALNDRAFVGCFAAGDADADNNSESQRRRRGGNDSRGFDRSNPELHQTMNSAKRSEACLVFELEVRAEEGGSVRAEPQDVVVDADTSPRQIQSVAIDKFGDWLVCGVACYSKALLVYRIDLRAALPGTQAGAAPPPPPPAAAAATTATTTAIPARSGSSPGILVKPSTIHRTSKRAGCLCFARVPAGDSAERTGDDPDKGAVVLIAGDLSGDAVAFPLTAPRAEKRAGVAPTAEAGDGDAGGVGGGGDSDAGREAGEDGASRNRKLLLGHTASTLTGVRVTEARDGTGRTRCRILTSDRDEKVRVSAFPEAFRIEGYLLGHEAFVSCLDVAQGNPQSTICATASGDGTVRLWDYSDCQELCCHPVNPVPGSRLVPSRVAIHSSGTRVAVIYDESPLLDVLQVADDSSRLVVAGTVECSAPALSLSWLSSDDVLLVLITQPPYVMGFRLDRASSSSSSSSPSFHLVPWTAAAVSALNRAAGAGGCFPTAMPGSVLEKDQFGQPMMKKNRERRGPAADMPWNNAERKRLSKEREKRYKKQKRDEGLAKRAEGGGDKA